MSLLEASRSILKEYGIRLRKRWGQHLLIDEEILEKIVEASCLKESDIILEIGPGTGILTRRLANKAGKVIAIEIDPRLIELLKEELKSFTNITIIKADILRFDLSTLYPPLTKIKVVANLPFYIGTHVLLHLLDKRDGIESMVIMVQKEVGERILARPGGKEYGLLSISIQSYTKPELIGYVPRTSFSPQPKVDGAILRLKVLDRPLVVIDDEGFFFKLIMLVFSKRRKMLLNTLSRGLDLEKRRVESILIGEGIDPKRRPETLSIQEFGRLSNAILYNYNRGLR